MAKVGADAKESFTDRSCRDAFMYAENPILAIKEYIKTPMWKEALVALKHIGAGSSAWAELFLLRSMPR